MTPYIISYIVLLALFVISWKRFQDIQHDKINELNHVDMNEVEPCEPTHFNQSPLNK